MRYLPAFILVLGAACGITTGSVRATKDVTLSAPHVAGQKFSVESRNGSVEVHGDPALSEVKIWARIVCGGKTKEEAERRLAETKVVAERDANGILQVVARFPAGRSLPNDGASIKVRMPDAKGGIVKTSNGNVTVTRIAGKVTVRTSNGRVQVTDLGGTVDVDTSNGNVRAVNIAGPLVVRTSNGTITAEGIQGRAKLISSNGNVHIVLTRAGPLSVSTSNGTVDVTVGRRFLGTVSIGTSNGSIQVEDPAGRITSQHIRKTSAKLQVGDGGDASSVTTSNGNVRFKIEK